MIRPDLTQLNSMRSCEAVDISMQNKSIYNKTTTATEATTMKSKKSIRSICFGSHHKIAFDLKFKPVKRLLDYWIGYVLMFNKSAPFNLSLALSIYIHSMTLISMLICKCFQHFRNVIRICPLIYQSNEHICTDNDGTCIKRSRRRRQNQCIIQAFTPHSSPFGFDKGTGERENHEMDFGKKENSNSNSQRKSEIEFQ